MSIKHYFVQAKLNSEQGNVFCFQEQSCSASCTSKPDGNCSAREENGKLTDLPSFLKAQSGATQRCRVLFDFLGHCILRTQFNGEHGGARLDLMVLKVFSNFKHSVIL